MLSLQNQISWFNRALGLMALAMLLMVGGFFALVYKPKTAQLADLNNQIEQNRLDLSNSKDQTKILPNVASDVQRLTTKLSNFKKLPHQQELPDFMRNIAELSEQAKLKFDMVPGQKVTGQRLSELPIKMSMEGDFVNIYSFLGHCEQLQRLTRVSDMTIKQKDRDGQVKVQLTMNIYFAEE